MEVDKNIKRGMVSILPQTGAVTLKNSLMVAVAPSKHTLAHLSQKNERFYMQKNANVHSKSS
jgi:hypothetical protein